MTELDAKQRTGGTPVPPIPAGFQKPAVPMRSLAIVLPCRDEAGNVERAVRGALREGARVAGAVEVIVVNDGSTDATGRIAAGLATEDSRVRVVTHEQTRGYGAALRSGFAAATSDWVLHTDGDGQFDLGDLPALAAGLETADAAIGYRVRRSDSFVRRMNGKAWTMLTRILLGFAARDVDCAFKVWPREFVQRCGLVSTGAMISAELLTRAKRAGIVWAEAPVKHLPRVEGEQSGANVRVILRAFKELWRLKRAMKREGMARG